jgi:GNAT superfamily N-acetyltransferase
MDRARPLVEGDIVVSDDRRLLDVPFIHACLTRSYWAAGIPIETVRRSIENALCFGAYDRSSPPPQVGFARVITHRATFAYGGDVFVIEGFRGRGVSKLMMRAIVTHPDLQGLRRWKLLTADAHGLYRQFGFTAPARPGNIMERWDPDVYRAPGPC